MLRLSLSSVFPFLPHLLCNQSVISSFATFLRSFTQAQHFTILHLTSRIYFLTCHPVSTPPTHFICEFWNTALLRTFKDLLKPLFWHWRPPKWVLLLSSPSPSPSISKVVHSFLPNCHVHIFFAHILLHLLMCPLSSDCSFKVKFKFDFLKEVASKVGSRMEVPSPLFSFFSQSQTYVRPA